MYKLISKYIKRKISMKKYIIFAAITTVFASNAQRPPVVPLETARLIMRPASLDDAPDIAQIACNPEVTGRTGLFPELTTLDDVKRFIQVYLEKDTGRYPFSWVIVEKETNNLVGLVAFFGFMEGNKKIEIGYAVKPAAWNKGYITEASTALIAHLFSNGLYRIQATVDPENLASQRVLQKIGMSYEGLLKAYMIVNGVHRDRKMYAIINN